MKNQIVIMLCALIVLCAGNVSAQNAFSKGTIGINAGLGFGNNTWGTGFQPSFNLAGDYAIKDVIHDNGSFSVGAIFGFGGNKDEFSIRGGVRGLLHYTFVDKLDTYGGIAMGFKYSKGKENDDYWNLATIHEPETHFVFIPLTVGARYMFTDQFGAFVESAISKFAYWQIGVSVMF